MTKNTMLKNKKVPFIISILIILIFGIIITIFIKKPFSSGSSKKINETIKELYLLDTMLSEENEFSDDERKKIYSEENNEEKGKMYIIDGYYVMKKNYIDEYNSENNLSDDNETYTQENAETEKLEKHETDAESENLKNYDSDKQNKTDEITGLSLKNPEPYFKEAINILSSINDIENTALAYYNLAKYYLLTDNLEISEENFEKACSLFDGLEDSKKAGLVNIVLKRDIDENVILGEICHPDLVIKIIPIAKTVNSRNLSDLYYDLGLYYWYNGKTVLATAYKLEALNCSEELGDNIGMCSMLIDLGIDSLELENYDEAIDYIQQGLSMLNTSEEELSVGMIDNFIYAGFNLYECYARTNNLEKAAESLNSSRHYLETYTGPKSKKMSDHYLLLRFNEADLLCRQGKYKESQEILNECRKEFENLTEGFFYVGFELFLDELQGNIYYGEKKYNDALEYHLKILNTAEENNEFFVLNRYNRYVYNDYYSLENFSEATKYAEKIIKLKDDAKNEKDHQYSQYLINQFNDNKKEEQLQEYKANETKTKIIFSAFTAVILLITAYTCIIIHKNRQIKKLNKKFHELSITDPLTGLSNRRSLDDYLEINWKTLAKNHTPVYVAMIDIDHFKKYNDNYGHGEGDKVLRDVAQSIKNSCRAEDFTARYGGEEFSIIIPGIQKEKIQEKTEYIIQNVRNLNIKHEYSTAADFVTISLGYSYTDDASLISYEKLMKTADDALYEAKKKRNSGFFIDSVSNK